MTNVGMFNEVKIVDENKQLKKRIKDLEVINKQHQELNGRLREEVKGLKEDIDRLSEERDNFETLAKQKKCKC